MELKIRNRDYVPDGAGGLQHVMGRDELLQRILFRLCARRGAFPFAPTLGSELHLLGREKPANRNAAAKKYIAEALRREAIAALMRINADSFTLAAINATISGCGIHAAAEETEQKGVIRVRFPDTAGVPDDFPRVRQIILDIIPCHLLTEFFFRYLTWAECEERGFTWESAEKTGHTWESFEKAVSV